jgi:DNA-binding MarR family transcriptional regulator
MRRLRNFSFLLSDVSRRYVLRFERHARALSLTLPQCRALVRLEGNEGVSQARLAELSAMEPMMMVSILDRLEEDGLVERRPHPADRRARCLHFTAKGRRALEEIWRLAEAARAEVFAGVSARERDAFLEVLERIHGNVCALEDEPGASEPAAKRSRSTRKA